MIKRPQWEIDLILEALVGDDVRVGAASFSPPKPNGEWEPCRSVSQLILPDNTSGSGLPVYFEGRLRRFDREIGVVSVELDAPALLELFNAMDLWRRPERFAELVVAALAGEPDADGARASLARARDAAMAVNAGEIAKASKNPGEIQKKVAAARLAAIAQTVK